jgi:hypothetical protein
MMRAPSSRRGVCGASRASVASGTTVLLELGLAVSPLGRRLDRSLLPAAGRLCTFRRGAESRTCGVRVRNRPFPATSRFLGPYVLLGDHLVAFVGG